MPCEIPRTWPRNQALLIAEGVLAGKIGIIAGCISLSSLAHDMVPDWGEDPDFVLFGAIASESDHLPFGEVRTRWSTLALDRADREIADITQLYEVEVRAACEHVLSRFQGVKTFP
jgi:hypothetical protein